MSECKAPNWLGHGEQSKVTEVTLALGTGAIAPRVCVQGITTAAGTLVCRHAAAIGEREHLRLASATYKPTEAATDATVLALIASACLTGGRRGTANSPPYDVIARVARRIPTDNMLASPASSNCSLFTTD